MKTSTLRRTPAARRAATLAVAGLVALAAPFAAQAQGSDTSAKPSLKGTKRPPPNPSATQTIPAGVDAGTPATSNSAELGLKTMPKNDAERAGVKQETAAARAAARRRGPAASETAASGPAPAAPTVVKNGAKGKEAPKPGGWTP